ncbi:universal stress protein [Catenuloplanes japonicus]|uniref:universal stress protein n=1 Tax=Catenuloplanes japonicus TaxID=33876 RepID=UPI0005258CB6|nr:universal stress protein [Catenuloplanes japonicus]
MTALEIIVGTDGSPGGDRAVRWAAREARLSGRPLRIITTFDWNRTSGRVVGGATERELAQSAAGTVLADARLIAHGIAPGTPVHGEAVAVPAASALIEAGRRAGVLVVGCRGRGGFASLLLGSVSQHVAMHARCPVAVVRGPSDMRVGPVATGVDGGPATAVTLATAFALAAERRAPLLAIRAYAEPGGLRDAVLDAALHAVEADLDREIAPWREKYPAVPVATRVVAGDARSVLLEASRHAQILVLGGHSGHGGVLPGFVALRALHHAECPVVVARDPGHGSDS